MTQQEFADIITLVRRAPLANMQEAEHVANLLQRLGDHIKQQFAGDAVDPDQ